MCKRRKHSDEEDYGKLCKVNLRCGQIKKTSCKGNRDIRDQYYFDKSLEIGLPKMEFNTYIPIFLGRILGDIYEVTTRDNSNFMFANKHGYVTKEQIVESGCNRTQLHLHINSVWRSIYKCLQDIILINTLAKRGILLRELIDNIRNKIFLLYTQKRNILFTLSHSMKL